MKTNLKTIEYAVDILKSARQLADYAIELGVSQEERVHRPVYDHMGAILADSILQAGLNYASVVKPRVEFILNSHSEKRTSSTLIEMIDNQQTADFLNWSHTTKINRFESIVRFMYSNDVNTSADLREKLELDSFGVELLELDGVGPKTVDYMKCLVGIDSVAVDRHIRTFAQEAGIVQKDYEFLHKSFCSAADLLSISRRSFDSWVWSTLATSKNPQQSFIF
ncbi:MULTISPECIES: hypothetical protein [Vibrio]|uniref:hypothetical protein n=1 Tax=Vibrio TaxID=662 RepID=UPI000CF42D8F|nr:MULTISPECIES: hypothetical protein [Vibrio]NOI94336.1 hypothetical protein [Vibrio sp. T3Y01]PQJ56498.1 hypothetical protein BTO12_02790 [Vibrio splendidus]